MTIAERLARVRAGMAEACSRCGRDPGSVRLVAVSKGQPAAAVAEAFQAGQRVFGESYVQEALAKREALAGLAAQWHYIGGLQANKARHVAGRFALVHSVDSLNLARLLHNKAQALGLIQPVLVQVNVAGEPQKRGVSETGLAALAEEIAGLSGLALQGLMVMPPYDEDPERSRPHFARLRELADGLRVRLGPGLAELSMGMSHDYGVAIEEGATLVRVGTAVFGPRPCALAR